MNRSIVQGLRDEVSRLEAIKQELQKDPTIPQAIRSLEKEARAIVEEKDNEIHMQLLVLAVIRVLRSGDFFFKTIHPELHTHEEVASMVYEQVIRVRDSLARSLAEEAVKKLGVQQAPLRD